MNLVTVNNKDIAIRNRIRILEFKKHFESLILKVNEGHVVSLDLDLIMDIEFLFEQIEDRDELIKWFTKPLHDVLKK